MAITISYRILLTVGLLGLVGASASSVDEFKKIQHDIFIGGPARFSFEQIKQLIGKMIELIEGGDISAEIQGEQNLEFLRMLQGTCDYGDKLAINDALSKLQQLKNITTEAPNFQDYLEVCQVIVRKRSEDAVFERVEHSLKYDQQVDKTVKILASEVWLNFLTGPQRRHYRPNRRDMFDENFSPIVVRTFKKLEPQESKKIASKWLHMSSSLVPHLEKIRESCAVFEQQLDPAVQFWPARYFDYEPSGAENLMSWLHFRLRGCKSVLAQWATIVEESTTNAKE